MMHRALRSMFALAMLAAPSATAAQQATVAGTTVPPDEPTIVVRLRDRYDGLKAKGIAITAGTIVSGSGVSAGIALGKPKFLGVLGAVVEARWSVRGYRQLDASGGMTAGRRHRTELRPIDADVTSTFNQNSLLTFGKAIFVHARELRYPRVDYYGPAAAAASSDEGRSDYGLQGGAVDVVGQWQRPHYGASARFGTLRLHLETPTNDGLPDTRDLYAAAGLPGLDAQHHFRTIGAAFTVDFRDLAHLTESGTFAGVALWRAIASDTSDSSLNWSRLNVDVQQFVRVRKGRQVIALRGVMAARIDDGATPMPFYLQPTLGGGRSLRGFGSYRLRDESVWSANAEYRWRVHRRVELAPFLDLGNAASRFSDFRAAGAEVAPGIGLRIVGGSRIIARLDFAHGRDGSRLMFALGSPF